MQTIKNTSCEFSRTTAAFFDVDGTLMKTNAVEHYLNLISTNINKFSYWYSLFNVIIKIPYYLLIDQISRQLCNQVFYSNYRNFYVIEFENRSSIYFQEKLKYQIFPAAQDCINQHQIRGDLVILVTGSLDFIIKPLAEFLNANRSIATSLETKNGFYTGQIKALSPIGEEKAKAIHNLSMELGIDLSNSYAYGDSIFDLPMLEAVGNPVVVNPDQRLKRIALKKGWTQKYWSLEK